MSFEMPFIPSECYGPECEEDAYSRGLCRPHYEKLVRYEAKLKLERFCEGPDCIFALEAELPLDAKYCSDHCKNNARRQRDGLPLHRDLGPRSAEEKTLRAAGRVIRQRGLRPAARPDEIAFRQMAADLDLNLDDEDLDDDD